MSAGFNTGTQIHACWSASASCRQYADGLQHLWSREQGQALSLYSISCSYPDASCM